ncbi:MAG: hypothetical protein WC234_01990 [Endomicrobiaceae bacterium]|nr:hypothetical protein [Candidatus Cloacimonadota bacterium]
MDVLFFIIKALIILTVNIGLGYLLSYCFNAFFFFPKKLYFLGKYQVPFTPGLLHRKKKLLITYLSGKLYEYNQYVHSEYFEKNFLTDFENKIFDEIYPYVKNFMSRNWMPDFLKTKIEYLMADLVWMLIYKLTRTIIPKLLRDHQAEKQILLLDLKLDIYKLKELFDEYVYKYLLYFNLAFFTVIGIINTILFILLA